MKLIVCGLVVMFHVLLVGLSMGQEPVEGKKNRDKHKHVEPVDPATPAPPHIEPVPDPNFADVLPDQPDVEKRPKKPERVDPVSPVGPAVKPVVIHKGSWSSWFGGLFFGIVVGVAGSWASTLVTVRKWIGL